MDSEIIITVIFPIKGNKTKTAKLPQSTLVSDLEEFLEEDFGCPKTYRVFLYKKNDQTSSELPGDISLKDADISDKCVIYGYVKLRNSQPEELKHMDIPKGKFYLMDLAINQKNI